MRPLLRSKAVTARAVVLWSLAAAVGVVVAMFIALAAGPTSMQWEKLLRGQPLEPTEKAILLDIRLPRVLLTGLVGMALGVSGVVLQALLRNPLAEPFVLGISSGAALGALGSMALGASVLPLATPMAAFLGAMGTVFLVLAVGGARGRLDMTRVLLTGVIVNAFFTSLIMLILSLSRSEQIHSMMFWLYGDLSGARYAHVGIVAPGAVVALTVIWSQARGLNAMGIGEQTALQLGVQVERSKVILLGVTSLLTGAVVSVSGLIAFVGLIVPHLVRMLLGADHRLLIPVTALGGAAFLVLADAVARTLVSPAEVPVGVITAAMGAPFFVLLLKTKVTRWDLY